MESRSLSHENSPLLCSSIDCGHDEDENPRKEPATTDLGLAIKVAAAMYSFSTLGLFNSSVGVVLPLLSQHYNITDLHVSLIFLVGPIGYFIAAQCADAIHFWFGQRGVAFFGPLLQVIATGLISTHQSFGVVLAGFFIQGVGTGLLDGSWCAWAGSMEKANTISGLLHGSYSVGGAVGPFLVMVITARHQSWYLWYCILTVISVLEFVVLVSAFRAESASVYRRSKQSTKPDSKVDVKTIFKYRATWLCAVYFLTYVGTETAISGWIVLFMLRTRNATLYVAGLSASGYWVGMAIGRLVLGFSTDRVGVRRATTLYFTCAVLVETAFAVFTSPMVSVVLMTMLGFFMGPLFPSGVVVLTRLLPREVHVAAVSFVASLGQVGGAFLPFAIGAIVQGVGIGVFRYVVLVQTVLALLVWTGFAGLRADASVGSSEARGEEDRQAALERRRLN